MPTMPWPSEQFQKLAEKVLSEKPETADAVVWIQGDRFDRGGKVVELFAQGFAPKVVIVGNNILVGPNTRPGENDTSLEEMYSWLISQGVPPSATVVIDGGLNTWEQAVRLSAQARERGWKKLLLVSSPYHQVRVHLTFLKAFSNTNIALVNQPALDISWDTLASGRTKTGAQLLADEYRKILGYGDHVAPIEEGLRYYGIV